MCTDKIDIERMFRRHARNRMGFCKYYSTVVAGNSVRFLATVIGLLFLPFYLINLLGEFLCDLCLRHSKMTDYFHDEWVKAFDEFRAPEDD